MLGCRRADQCQSGEQRVKGQSLRRRMGFALNGLQLTFRRERSFRTQLLGALAVLVLLVVTRPAPLWWAVLILTAGFVLVTELLNSALETLIDHLHPEQHPEIGAVKDMAAGAVLVSSLIAVAVALFFVLAQLDF